MNSSRALWIRTATSLVGQGLNLALGVAASIPVGRGLGPSGKGEFALYGWAVSLGVVLLGRGWHSAVAAVASQDDQRGIDAVRLGRRWLLPIAAALLVVSLGCLLAGSRGWSLAAAVAACQIWAQPASGALVGSGRLTAYYAGVIAQNAVLLAGVGLLWSRQALTPEGAMAVLGVGVLSGMFVHSVAARTGLGMGRAADPAMAALRTLSRDVWIADLATFLTYRLDVAMVRFFTGSQGLGLYSTATAIAELGRIAPNAIGQAALKELGRVGPDQRRAVAVRTIVGGVAASALFLGSLAVVSPWLIPQMYGAAFAPAAPLVAWLAPGITLLTVASAASSWLVVGGRSAVTARIAWRGCAISAVVSFVFISTGGITGAALASTVGYAVLAAMTWRAASR